MRQLWQTRDGRVSHQVLQEYYVTVTRKLRPGLSIAAAREDLRALMEWRPVVTDSALIEQAWSLEDKFGLSFWDASIVAAASIAGATTLLTEDLQDGQDIDGVVVVNPFRHPPPAEQIHDR